MCKVPEHRPEELRIIARVFRDPLLAAVRARFPSVFGLDAALPHKSAAPVRSGFTEPKITVVI